MQEASYPVAVRAGALLDFAVLLSSSADSQSGFFDCLPWCPGYRILTACAVRTAAADPWQGLRHFVTAPCSLHLNLLLSPFMFFEIALISRFWVAP